MSIRCLLRSGEIPCRSDSHQQRVSIQRSHNCLTAGSSLFVEAFRRIGVAGAYHNATPRGETRQFEVQLDGTADAERRDDTANGRLHLRIACFVRVKAPLQLPSPHGWHVVIWTTYCILVLVFCVGPYSLLSGQKRDDAVAKQAKLFPQGMRRPGQDGHVRPWLFAGGVFSVESFPPTIFLSAARHSSIVSLSGQLRC